jgi:predicted MFS family arabinose efflux permease
VILLLAAVLALNSADTGMIGALAGQLERDLHLDHTRLGLLATVSAGVGAAASLPMGLLADRTRRVPVLVGTIVAWAVAMAAGGLATSYLWLLLSRLALGAALAAAGPVVASLIGDLFPPDDRARVLGWILSGELIGAGAGLVVGVDMAAVLSWRSAFFLLAAASAGLAVALGRLLPEPARGGADWLRADGRPDAGRRDDGDAGGGRPALAGTGAEPVEKRVLRIAPRRMSLSAAITYLLRIPTVRVLIIASSVGYFFFAGLRTFAVVFVERRFGVSQTALTGLVPLVGAGALAGTVAAGRLTDVALRRGHPAARVITPGIAYAAAACFLAPGLLTASVPLAMLLFTAGAAGLGAANPPLDAARLDIVPAGLRGRAESLRTVLRLAAEAAAPVTFGFVADELGNAAGRNSAPGLRDAFLIMLVPLLANALLIFRARRSYLADVATATASDDRMGS